MHDRDDDARIEALEERIAHLDRAAADLSDTVAAQAAQIARLTRQADMLMAREAEREFDTGASVPVADRPPPHW